MARCIILFFDEQMWWRRRRQPKTLQWSWYTFRLLKCYTHTHYTRTAQFHNFTIEPQHRVWHFNGKRREAEQELEETNYFISLNFRLVRLCGYQLSMFQRHCCCCCCWSNKYWTWNPCWSELLANSRRTNRTSLIKVKQLRHHSAASILLRADTNDAKRISLSVKACRQRFHTRMSMHTSTSIRLCVEKRHDKSISPYSIQNEHILHTRKTVNVQPTHHHRRRRLTLRLLLLLLFFVCIFVWRHIRSLGFPCRNLGIPHNWNVKMWGIYSNVNNSLVDVYQLSSVSADCGGNDANEWRSHFIRARMYAYVRMSERHRASHTSDTNNNQRLLAAQMESDFSDEIALIVQMCRQIDNWAAREQKKKCQHHTPRNISLAEAHIQMDGENVMIK